ncbi:MAG: T9SS type A sorting domain-containing protein [Mameliella sp.]|nr:T9SS type A sorting domain-containing protein [Phaeodactylibacter sp.]
MQKFWLLLLCIIYFIPAQAQETEDCNKLGAWLWYIEITGFDTHAAIADSLSSMGVKRVYVKVADGGINPSVWPELLDAQLVQDYKSRGLEVWAWSYNYPGNDSLQAEALYKAAETGYEGFVVDVEIEFDGDSTNLHNLFSGFYDARERAINDNVADAGFPLYCTTWGNPIDHNFRIDVMDPFVDGYMPQTYVEVWGSTYINNLSYWIEVGNDEYAGLGATKPVHHICATESGAMTPAELNEFIATGGPETSLWRIPGGGTPLSIWNDWAQVEWDMDFCTPTNTEELDIAEIKVYPNPFQRDLFIELAGSEQVEQWQIYSIYGQKVAEGQSVSERIQIPATNWAQGTYLLEVKTDKGRYQSKLIKTNF